MQLEALNHSEKWLELYEIVKESNMKNTLMPIVDCIIAANTLLNHAIILSDTRHFDSIKELNYVWI